MLTHSSSFLFVIFGFCGVVEIARGKFLENNQRAVLAHSLFYLSNFFSVIRLLSFLYFLLGTLTLIQNLLFSLLVWHLTLTHHSFLLIYNLVFVNLHLHNGFLFIQNLQPEFPLFCLLDYSVSQVLVVALQIRDFLLVNYFPIVFLSNQLSLKPVVLLILLLNNLLSNKMVSDQNGLELNHVDLLSVQSPHWLDRSSSVDFAFSCLCFVNGDSLDKVVEVNSFFVLVKLLNYLGNLFLIKTAKDILDSRLTRRNRFFDLL